MYHFSSVDTRCHTTRHMLHFSFAWILFPSLALHTITICSIPLSCDSEWVCVCELQCKMFLFKKTSEIAINLTTKHCFLTFYLFPLYSQFCSTLLISVNKFLRQSYILTFMHCFEREFKKKLNKHVHGAMRWFYSVWFRKKSGLLAAAYLWLRRNKTKSSANEE